MKKLKTGRSKYLDKLFGQEWANYLYNTFSELPCWATINARDNIEL